MLGVRTAFVGPVTSAAVQCSCAPLTIMCCDHRRPREANMFRVLPMASGRGSTIIFNVSLFVIFLLLFFFKEFNTLRTSDADLRFYITTVQDG